MKSYTEVCRMVKQAGFWDDIKGAANRFQDRNSRVMAQTATRSMQNRMNVPGRDVFKSRSPVTPVADMARDAERIMPSRPQHVRNAIHNALEQEKANANAQTARQASWGALARETGKNIANGPFGRFVTAPFRASNAVATGVEKLKSKLNSSSPYVRPGIADPLPGYYKR